MYWLPRLHGGLQGRTRRSHRVYRTWVKYVEKGEFPNSRRYFLVNLLVADLKRPDRALFLVTKANPASWLVWGGYILGVFGLIEAAWFGAALLGLPDGLRWLLLPAALCGSAAGLAPLPWDCSPWCSTLAAQSVCSSLLCCL